MNKSIVLIGMPGCGKSTVGVVLAKKMGYSFIDSDLLIQTRYKQRLFEIIDEQGLASFRNIENEVNLTIKEEKAIIATGGSVIYGKEAMEAFHQNCVVVYLKLPIAEVELRLGDLHQRGVVIEEGKTLTDLYEERVPLYEKYAHISIQCAGKSIPQIIGELIDKYNGFGGS